MLAYVNPAWSLILLLIIAFSVALFAWSCSLWLNRRRKSGLIAFFCAAMPLAYLTPTCVNYVEKVGATKAQRRVVTDMPHSIKGEDYRRVIADTENKDPHIAATSTSTLGWMAGWLKNRGREVPPEISATLIRRLDSEDRFVLREAALGLRDCGPLDPTVIARLKELVRLYPDSDISWAATEIIQQHAERISDTS